VSEAPVAIQMTIDHASFSQALDEAGQALAVGFVARIERLDNPVRRCSYCGKRRICFAIRILAIGNTGDPGQIIGAPKCAEHAGIR
jgi:hypothetical protein